MSTKVAATIKAIEAKSEGTEIILVLEKPYFTAAPENVFVELTTLQGNNVEFFAASPSEPKTTQIKGQVPTNVNPVDEPTGTDHETEETITNEDEEEIEPEKIKQGRKKKV